MPLIAVGMAWADYAKQLGVVADTCALADPLLPPARVMQALEGVRPPLDGVDVESGVSAPAMPSTRLLRLATSASRNAALSSRQEIYPTRMPARQALRHALGALVGMEQLSVDELKSRVRGRYPEAEPLPGRPLLDRLLEEAAAPLQWDEISNSYRRQSSSAAGTTGITTLYQRASTKGNAISDGQALDAQQMEERLQRSMRQGGLLVLSVPPRLALRAEAELLRRFSAGGQAGAALQRVSIDALLLSAIKEQATAMRVDWNLVLRADTAAPNSRDWVNLQRLVQKALPALKAALLESNGPLLIVNPGLLARYALMSLVSELEARVGQPGVTPTVWLLLPTHKQGLPTIDGVSVPLVNAGAAASLPSAWLETPSHIAAVA